MVDQDFFTVGEIAEKLKVSYKSVYRWVQAGELAAYKFGTDWRIGTADLERFIEQRRQGGTEEDAEREEELEAERRAEEEAELQAEEDAERQAEEDTERQAEEDAELNTEEEAERRAPFLDR